ncbi:S-adenosyl-L-methionine-dependent methyltransferase [Lichtheimia hyalospora FSU 10163]|nr:S-adenosyl-L-methionine-dependent methyltransferase [Lichtheimia hyalospora FSU 10163]
MGYWEGTTQTYSEACSKLVEKVVTSMQLKRNTRILDVGYGCGDSCFLLADQFNCQVVGVTNESEQWKISCSRLATQYAQLEDRIQLIQGSATDIQDLFRDHPLFDYIISIDSAYHYATRWDFFNAALSRLVPGGSIGLYDLAATQSADSNAILKFACQHVLGIPPTNLVTMDEYKNRMVAIGYTDVHLEALDQDQIFGGLSRFIERQYEQAARWDVLPPVGNRIFLRITMWIFRLMSQKKWLQPVIVRAKKA